MSELTLVVSAGAGTDDEELEWLTDQLRRELLQLDVDTVRRPRVGDAPPGAKAVGVAAIGALVVELARSSTMLTAVIGAVQSWLGGRAGRSVKLQLDGDLIEVTGISSSDQHRLIDAWIARHVEA
jgi:hypothetical protein